MKTKWWLWLAGVAFVLLTPREVGATGACLAARFNDWQDCMCSLLNPGAGGVTFPCHCPPPGMPQWWVSEPYINLCMSDTPLSYTTSSGQEMAFTFYYHQRTKMPDSDEVPTGYYRRDYYPGGQLPPGASPAGYGAIPCGTNASWGNNWTMSVMFWDAQWENDWTEPLPLHYRAPDYSPYTVNYEALVFKPEGGLYYFTKSSAQEPRSQVRLVPLSGLDYPYVTYYLPSAPTNEIYWGSTNLGFKLVYPDGSQDVFSLIVYATSNYQASTARAFLTQRIDPQGRATRVGYEYVIFTNSYYSPPAYERAYRVHYVVDPDGRTNTFQYTFDLPFRPYDAWQFSEIDDPYGRKARFTYGYSLPLISTNNAPGLLSSIIDAVGMTNAFKYQPNGTWSPAGPNINGTRSSGWITNLSTPYGNTSFSYYEVPDDTVTDGFWQRAIAVSEPEGAQQLYFYVHTNWTMADTEPSPSNIPGQTDFDDGTSGAAHYSINFRNSFHWGRRQFPALSQAVRNYISVGQLNNALNSLTTNDYNLAHLKHWLLSSIDTNSITESLSSERDPSPDAAGQIPGLRTWYNYPGKTARNLLGSNPQVSCVARSLPDGSSQYITYNYNSPSSFGSFVSDNESSYSRPDGTIGVLTYWFHYAANYVDLASVSNSAGQWWNLGYNTNHQITAITNALNQVTALSWNPNLTGIQFPNGQSIGLSYYTQSSPPTSTSALIKQITIQPEGRVFNINNYTAGNPSSITDDRGLTVANIWDGLNRLTGTIYPDTTYTSNRYDRLDLGAARDRLGSWTYYVHDGLQHLTTVTNANNAVTIYSWCGCGSLNQIFDALNGTTNPTTLNYDNQGNLTNVLYPDATSLMYQFDLAGRMTSAADGAGRAVQIAYNNQGLATIVSGAYGSLASIVYDALNRPISVTDANGITVTNQYDAINELLKRTWPDGTSESYGYSAAGLMAYTNRDQKVTRFGRDAAGRLTAVTNANLEVVQAGYDSLDNIISLVDGLQHTTTWQYNQYGWLTNKVDGLNRNVFRFAYNANGWVTNRWTPEKGNTAYKFDAVGNLTNIFYVGQASSLSYSYDALNHLRTMLDAIGTTAFSYTPAGQLAGEDGPWANDTVTNTYVQGLRTAMSLHSQPSTLNFSYGYDSAWRMTNVISPAGTFGYNYGAPNSASALVTGISLPNAASITNGYDALARLTQTALNNKWGHTLDSYAYIPDALGLRTNIVRNLGLTTSSVTVGYDNIGQLTSWAAAESGGTPRLNEQLGFGYDAAHNLHSRTSGALSQTFNTDAANELTNVTRTGTFTVSGATPAPATSVTVNGQAAQTYGDFTFARTNLTLADGQNIFTNIAQNGYGVCRTNTLTVNLPTNVNLSSDNNGSLTNDGTRAFAYDSENQLTNVSVAEQWKSEFIYDGLGRRRVAKDYAWQGGQWVKTNEVRYVYDGMLAIQERDTNNNPLVTYTRGLDLCGTRQRAGGIGGLLARTDINGSTFYHADAHGNITALMDGNENIVARYLYNPYGKLVGEWGGMAEANKYRFSSKEWDPLSGMYYYGFRFYDPNLQRWPNQDPIGERGGINLYRYVGNNPVNKIDPLGHFGVEADSSSGGVNGVPNIMVNFTPDGHTTISNNDSPEALRIAILFGTGFTAGGLTIIGGIEAPGLTTKVLLALLGVSQHKPDPCPPKDNTKYHYTSSPESDFEKGLRRETHVTDDPNLTSKEAVDKLGVTRPPDKVIPIQDKGDFVPSKPPTVDPNPAKGIGGGGTDYYNPSEVPPDQIGPAIPIDEE